MEKDPEKRITCDQALEHPWWGEPYRHTTLQPHNHRKTHSGAAITQQRDADCQVHAFIMESLSSHCHLSPWLWATSPPLQGTASSQSQICWINGCQLVAYLLKDPWRCWRLNEQLRCHPRPASVLMRLNRRGLTSPADVAISLFRQ